MCVQLCDAHSTTSYFGGLISNAPLRSEEKRKDFKLFNAFPQSVILAVPLLGSHSHTIILFFNYPRVLLTVFVSVIDVIM